MKSRDYKHTEPIAMTLDAGTYYRCQCGQSANYPFCDGSHAGTGLGPMPFKLTQKETVYLCNCGNSDGKPYCDGSHLK